MGRQKKETKTEETNPEEINSEQTNTEESTETKQKGYFATKSFKWGVQGVYVREFEKDEMIKKVPADEILTLREIGFIEEREF